MRYLLDGAPEESDIVLCTVTAINPTSVFVKLNEYKNKIGMIHISEISPGRIRNLRDFVKKGKVIVCKVLSINDRGNIDLSLRRVSEGQRRQKNEFVKCEMRAEKILDGVAKELKQKSEELYDSVAKIIFEKYPGLYVCFEDVALGSGDLEKLGFNTELATKLTSVIKDKIRPPEVLIKGNMLIKTFEPDGLSLIKKVFVTIPEDVEVASVGGGSYSVSVKSGDYKTAEKIMKDFIEKVEKQVKKFGSFEFVREKSKK
jgi:translation initiation factor 2 subunit 1